MEPSIYGSGSSGKDLRGLKKSMTLDFNTGPSAKAKKTLLLQSPDLNMLKLASPELEKMIMQASNMVTTTPTPTQFVFPKFVTEEQEAYARGFVDALAQLKSCDGPDDAGVQPKQPSTAKAVLSSNAFNIGQDYFPITSVASIGGTGLPETTLHQLTTTTTTLPNGVVLSSASLPVSSAAGLDMKPRILTDNCHGSSTSLDIHMPKDEQTVPCLGSSPPLSPINMESQERIKLERKRARNRVAARKCRTRKLERISRLEDRVKDLKGQNSDLLTTATSLREQVMKLKQQIVEHCNSGCQIMIQNIKL